MSEVEWTNCPMCHGQGVNRGYKGAIGLSYCSSCGGTGRIKKIPPLTEEEKKAIKARVEAALARLKKRREEQDV
jgi:DnaJ-class molecular chaperone